MIIPKKCKENELPISLSRRVWEQTLNDSFSDEQVIRMKSGSERSLCNFRRFDDSSFCSENCESLPSSPILNSGPLPGSPKVKRASSFRRLIRVLSYSGKSHLSICCHINYSWHESKRLLTKLNSVLEEVF